MGFMANVNAQHAFQVGAAGGAREDLLDLITTISPYETPWFSTFNKEAGHAIQPSWMVDQVPLPANPDAANPNAAVHSTPEGQDANFGALPIRARLNNLMHIFRETFNITETDRAINIAGMADSYAYYLEMALKLLKRNVEFAFYHSLRRAQAPAPGNAAGVLGRKMDGIWGLVQPNPIVGVNTTALEEGTLIDLCPGSPSPCVPLTEAITNDLVQVMKTKGTHGGDIFVNGFQKRVISGFTGFPNLIKNIDATAKTLFHTIDLYHGDFGMERIHYHDLVPNKDLLCLDLNHMFIKSLRPIKVTSLAKVGSSDKGMVEGELTFAPRSLAAIGVITCLCWTPIAVAS